MGAAALREEEAYADALPAADEIETAAPYHNIAPELVHLAVPVTRLRTFPRNPNHGDVESIKESLRFHGQYRAITYNARPHDPDAMADGVLSSGCILAGNHTYLAAVSLGWTHVAATTVDVDDDEALRIVLTDNETARRARPDLPLISEHLYRLGSLEGTGFDRESFASLTSRLSDWSLREADGAAGDQGGDEDDEALIGDRFMGGGRHTASGIGRVADLEATIDPTFGPSLCRAGDLLLFDGGKHRLLVGDARKGEDWDTLLSGLGGEPVQVVVTSPPYAQRRAYDASSPFVPPAPAEYVQWYQPVAQNIRRHLSPQGAYFLNIKAHCEEGERSLYVLRLVLAHRESWDFRFVEEYVWAHTSIPGSVKRRFKNGFEPIYFFAVGTDFLFRPTRHLRPSTTATHEQAAALKDARTTAGLRAHSRQLHTLQGQPGAGHEIRGAATAASAGMAYPSNVLTGLGVNTEAWGHAAMFPLTLPAFFVAAYSDPGQVICDPFAGAGTTMLAAAAAGRRSASLEISPHYADLCVERYRRAHPQMSLTIGDAEVTAEEWARAFARLGRTDAGQPQDSAEPLTDAADPDEPDEEEDVSMARGGAEVASSE